MSKTKITIVCNYYYPDVASIANLYRQLAEFLAQSMEVTVICAVPCYLGTVPEEYRNDIYYDESENGVRILRVGVPNYNKSSKLSRIKNLFYFISRSIAVGKRLGKQNIILAVSQPPVFGGFIGCCLRRMTRAKLIYNIQDFNPEQMEYSGFSKNPLIIQVLRALDNCICRLSDYVIVVSDDMKKTLFRRLSNKKVPENTVINNWVDTEIIKNVPRERNPLVEKYGLNSNDFIVAYAGNIGVMQNLQTFVLAAEALQDKHDIKFVFIGSGAWLNDMKEMVQKRGLNNVIFEPYEPIENIDLVYSLGDIEIVSIGENVTKCSMPSKTWNIFSCGVPVICQVDKDSELNRLIRDEHVGITIEPNDVAGLVAGIIHLYDSPSERKSMGRNARQLAEQVFDRNVSVQRYRNVIEQLALTE